MKQEKKIRTQLEQLGDDVRDRLTNLSGLLGDVNKLADELGYAVTGTFDFTVAIDTDDPTVQKLCIMMNFFLETIRRTIREIEDANRKLLETERLKSEFVANVSHELRTPLTLTLAPLESLLSGDYGQISNGQLRILQIMHNNAVRLLQMINGLLDFSRLEAGRVEVNLEPMDLVSLTRSILSDFQGLMTQRSLNSTFTSSQEHLWVKMDRYLYERILFNLLSNAVKFTKEGGNIDVVLQHNNDMVEMSVADTGIGIAPENQKTLFQKFRQIEASATRRFEGSGLGLSLTKEFVELLGGSVAVVSEVGEGSKFIVDLPAAVSAPLVGTSEIERRSIPQVQHYSDENLGDLVSSADRDGNLPRVLIAEDNVELAAYIASLLHGVCITKIATDGGEALDVMDQWTPDLILSDVMMPKVDGLELCRRVKSQAATANTPVILLTALTHRDAMLKGWEAGADDYLFKPFHPKELVSRIRASLNATSARTAAQASMRQARDQAFEASRFKSEFLARMSHEIRTPMNAVMGMLDLLLRSPLSIDQQEEAKTAYESAHALLDIINEILDFSRVESGRIELEETDIDLVQLVEGTGELLAEEARKKKLSLITLVERQAPKMIRGDAGRLRQVLLNVVGNGIKFTDQGEVTLRATTSEDGDRLLFSVIDTGIGLSRNSIDRLFEPFIQADGSITRRYGGTGLGLSISKHLVELMGGRISVESEEGRGSIFSIEIPLKRSAKTPAPIKIPPELRDIRVMCVDGPEYSSEMLSSYFESWGIKCTRMNSAEDALSALSIEANGGNSYQVLIVDALLADMPTFALAQAIKSRPLLSDTRLILLMPYADEHLAQEALTQAFDGVLSRPIRQSRLLDCIVNVVTDRNEERSGTTRSIPDTMAGSDAPVILVAEDNPANQKLIALQLQRLGYAAHCVGNGREAVEAVSRIPYALIMMDVMMPEMDGFQATGEIRRKETFTGRRIPIIAVTAHAMKKDREKCLAAGMDDYLSKPIDYNQLGALLRRWVPEKVVDRKNAGKPEASIGRVGERIARRKRPPNQQPDLQIDLALLRSRWGNDRTLRNLLNVFLMSVPSLLDDLNHAVRLQDEKAARDNIHKLYEAFTAFHCQSMLIFLERCEQAIASDSWAEAELARQALKLGFLRIQKEIGDYFAHPADAAIFENI